MFNYAKMFNFSSNRCNLFKYLILLTYLHIILASNYDDVKSCDYSANNLNNSKYFINRHKKHLVCYGDYNNYLDEFQVRLTSIESLAICSWSQLFLDVEDLSRKFLNLKKLYIINGNMTSLINSFPLGYKLEEIYIIGTQLNNLSNETFINLSFVHTVDLRNNLLTEMDPRTFNTTVLQRIYLDGNPWKCNENIFWILEMNDHTSLSNKIHDRDKLHCSAPYEGRPLMAVVKIIQNLKEECRKTVCDCELIYVFGRRNKERSIERQLIAFITVNCSYRGLTKMPDYLPANTTTLHLVGNKISDLTPLISNPIYRNVIDLHLDYNLIESITTLDSSDWFEHFRLLSLRGNKLTDLPTYALENVLRQTHAVSIYLGQNPWICNCLFTPSFRDLIIRYNNLVKDIDDIRCHLSDNNDIKHLNNRLIRDLTRKEICLIDNDEYTILHPLDALNIVLASLIIFVVVKFIYDYWSFKTTGKLPWIVTKIP